MNLFVARLVNKTDDDVGIRLRQRPGWSFVTPIDPWPVVAGGTATMTIFVRRARADFRPGERVALVFETNGREVQRQTVTLLGPQQ